MMNIDIFNQKHARARARQSSKDGRPVVELTPNEARDLATDLLRNGAPPASLGWPNLGRSFLSGDSFEFMGATIRIVDRPGLAGDLAGLEALVGQLRHASKLDAMGDDMTAVFRRIARGLRHFSDQLHGRAGDVMVNGEWCEAGEVWDKVQCLDDVPAHLRDDVPAEVAERWFKSGGVFPVVRNGVTFGVDLSNIDNAETAPALFVVARNPSPPTLR